MQTVVRILALSLVFSFIAGSASAELITWEWSGPVVASQLSIAIKPGTLPPVPLNLEGHGTVPVAILSSATFEARTVDPSTVMLAGAPFAQKRNGKLMWSLKDVNGDGLLDMVVRVSSSALQLSLTDTEARLEGKTVDGSIIRGSEAIRVVVDVEDGVDSRSLPSGADTVIGGLSPL